MNSKAIKRQLLAAIAMVLVAALALGSSTFAWFASNDTVTASGMNITAVTEGANLEISFSKTFTAGTIAVTRNETAKELKPTHYVTTADKSSGNYTDSTAVTTAGVWAHAFSNNYTAVSTANTYTNATVVDAIGTLGDAESSTEWALIVPVYLRLNPQSKVQMTNIKATAEINHSKTGTADGMNTAGRVAFITETGKATKAILNDTGYKDGENTGDTNFVCSNIEVAGDAGMKCVYAVIYFDGDDPSCTSEKFATDSYVVNLTFEGTEGGAITA